MLRKREGIVSLTQTEIMLVLAVVILLLLIAKSDDLSIVCDTLTDVSCAQILGAAKSPKPRNNTTPIAPDAEVTETLVPGGGQTKKQPLGVENSASQTEQEAAVAEEKIDEKTAAEIAHVVQESLGMNAEEINPEAVRATMEILKQQSKEAERLRNESAGAWTDFIFKKEKENPDNLRELQKENAELRKKLLGKARNEVGFLPCWLGAGWRGEKGKIYYLTYNVIYSRGDDSFRIKPHKDLKSGAESVNKALNGELAIIKNYPQGEITRLQFLQFAKKIDAAKKRQYGDNKCWLAITINKKNVDGTVTTDFIRDKAKFYPIQ